MMGSGIISVSPGPHAMVFGRLSKMESRGAVGRIWPPIIPSNPRACSSWGKSRYTQHDPSGFKYILLSEDINLLNSVKMCHEMPHELTGCWAHMLSVHVFIFIFFFTRHEYSRASLASSGTLTCWTRLQWEKNVFH